MTDPLNILDISHHQGTGPVGQRRATIDMRAVKAAGCAAVIVRGTYGTRIDELAAEHCRRADDAGLPRMHFGYHLSRQDPALQAELAYHHTGGARGGRAWRDLEESTPNDGAEPRFPRYHWDHWHHINAALLRSDDLTGLLTGLYSSKTWMDYWFTAEQQALWRHRPGWWAHYTSLPTPRIPWGWQNKLRPYELWQYAIGRWPGVEGPVDLDYGWPGLTLAELMGTAMLPPPVDDRAARIAGWAREIIAEVG